MLSLEQLQRLFPEKSVEELEKLSKIYIDTYDDDDDDDAFYSDDDDDDDDEDDDEEEEEEAPNGAPADGKQTTSGAKKKNKKNKKKNKKKKNATGSSASLISVSSKQSLSSESSSVEALSKAEESKKSKKVDTEKAMRDAVEGYNFVESLNYDKSFDRKISVQIISNERTYVVQRRNSVFNEAGRLTIKQVALSFIKAYRVTRGFSLSRTDLVDRMRVGNRYVVTRGSLNGLVNHLIRMNDHMDTDYLHELLVTYPLFMNPKQMFRMLMSCFNKYNVEAEDKIVQGAKVFTQVRTLEIIQVWLLRHPEDFLEEEELADLAQKFLEPLEADFPLAKEGLANLAHAQATKLPVITFPKEHVSSKTSLIFPASILPKDFAERLTWLETDLFKKIPLKNFHQYLKNPTGVHANSQLSFLEKWADRVSLWVAQNVCNPNTPKERAEIIAYFIQVANNLFELHNFEGVFQIAHALSSSAVKRLTKTWDLITGHYRESWEFISLFVSPANNHENYRGILKDTSDAALPSLDVYLHDLLAIQQLHEDRVSDGRVNFYKFHLLGSILNSIYYCQRQSIRPLESNPELDDIFHHIWSQVFTKKDLSLLSLQKEPNESSRDPVIFGAELVKLVQSTGVPCSRTSGIIPGFVADLMKFLRSEDRLKVKGIFRLSGNKANIEKIREESEKLGSLWIPEGGMGIHDATGLLKLYFTCLPDSLFTTELHRTFLKVSTMESKKDQLEAIKLNFAILPTPNRDLAISLFDFLHEVSLNSSSNSMDYSNLAVVFTPTLFFKKKSWTAVKEKFFNFNKGTVDMKALMKQQEEQDLLRPLFQIMIINFHELISSRNYDLPDLSKVYHSQQAQDPSERLVTKREKTSTTDLKTSLTLRLSRLNFDQGGFMAEQLSPTSTTNQLRETINETFNALSIEASKERWKKLKGKMNLDPKKDKDKDESGSKNKEKDKDKSKDKA